MAFRMDCFSTAHMPFVSPDLTVQIMSISFLNSLFYSKEPLNVRTQMGFYLPTNLLPGSQGNNLNVKQTIPLCSLAPSLHTHLWCPHFTFLELICLIWGPCSEEVLWTMYVSTTNDFHLHTSLFLMTLWPSDRSPCFLWSPWFCCAAFWV